MKGSDQTQKIAQKLRKQAASVYTPGVPITDPKYFSGRDNLLNDLTDQLDIQGKVIILYGDRGVGKTSFCNMLVRNRKAIKYSCTEKDNFITIFLNILRDAEIFLTEDEQTSILESGIEIGADGTFKVSDKKTQNIKYKPIGQERLDQSAILRRLKQSTQVDTIVFDEAQNLKDKHVHSQLSSLLKAFSDNHLDIAVIFVGIAETDENLFPADPDYAEYKLRHYTTAQIPPMEENEILDIIERREKLFKLVFDEKFKKDIAWLSIGYPSIAHTLALYSIFSWINRNATELIKKILLGGLQYIFFGLLSISLGKVRINIDRPDFLNGLKKFIDEFKRNYKDEALDLCKLFIEDEGSRILNSIIQLRTNSIPLAQISNELKLDEHELRSIIVRFSKLIKLSKDGNLKFAFSYLSSVNRACLTYIQEKEDGLAQIYPDAISSKKP